MKLTNDIKEHIVALKLKGLSSRRISKQVGVSKSSVNYFLNGTTHKDYKAKPSSTGPKILTLDIETAPILGCVWQLFKQNVSLDMIHRDWYVLSWAAKWWHEDEVMYEDKRETWKDDNDLELLKTIRDLLDEADVIITQNGIRFDRKKLNARFIIHGLKPPSSYRHIDTLVTAKKEFGFTSNKLAYMTDKLCKKYKKLSHAKYAGFLLWKECLAGNQEAWQEMKDYNVYDVLSLEELFTKMAPWMRDLPNLSLLSDGDDTSCRACGHDTFSHSGYHITQVSKFNKFTCDSCGHETRDRVNLVGKNVRPNLKVNVM